MSRLFLNGNPIAAEPKCEPKVVYCTKYDYQSGNVKVDEDTLVFLTDTYASEEPPRIKYPTNCKNCGAVMSSCKCSYCGTEYTYDENERRFATL